MSMCHLFVYHIYYVHKFETVLNHTFSVPTHTMTATSVRSRRHNFLIVTSCLYSTILKFWNIWDFQPANVQSALALPPMRNKTNRVGKPHPS